MGLGFGGGTLDDCGRVRGECMRAEDEADSDAATLFLYLLTTPDVSRSKSGLRTLAMTL